MSEWMCGVQTPRMKGPCVLWKGHADPDRYGMGRFYDPTPHRSGNRINDDTPRMRQFAHIVRTALDLGVQLSYFEIGVLMDHPNPRSVAQYGLGSRYTKLRQKMYRERGITKHRRRTAEQSEKIIREMREVLR